MISVDYDFLERVLNKSFDEFELSNYDGFCETEYARFWNQKWHATFYWIVILKWHAQYKLYPYKKHEWTRTNIWIQKFQARKKSQNWIFDFEFRNLKHEIKIVIQWFMIMIFIFMRWLLWDDVKDLWLRWDLKILLELKFYVSI